MLCYSHNYTIGSLFERLLGCVLVSLFLSNIENLIHICARLDYSFGAHPIDEDDDADEVGSNKSLRCYKLFQNFKAPKTKATTIFFSVSFLSLFPHIDAFANVE